MSETYIKAIVNVGDEEIKLGVFDDKYADPKLRRNKLHAYFLSLELETAKKLGISLTAYRAWLEMKLWEEKHEN